MRGETAVLAVTVARHFLAQTLVGLPSPATLAFPARDDRRNDYFFAQPRRVASHYRSAHLVPEDQGWFRHGRYAMVEIPEVRATHAASGDGDQHFPMPQIGK